MQRRPLIAAFGTGVVGVLAGCSDDSADGEQNADELDDQLEEDAEDAHEAEDEEPEEDEEDQEDEEQAETPMEPEAVVREYLEAAIETDDETLNGLTYGDDADFDDETRALLVDGTLEGVVEWDSVEAIQDSTTTSESGAQSIMEERDAEREATIDEDPAVEDLTYVFAVVTADGGDELVFTMVVVRVDDEWRVSDPDRRV